MPPCSEVVTILKKATDASIETGKRLKNTEITLRKMAAKFRDVKRTVAFEDQAPIQQTVDELEKMRTDLLAAMFGKKNERKQMRVHPSRSCLAVAVALAFVSALRPAACASASAIRSPLRKSISCAIPRMEPDLRLKLYVAFARARLAALDKARSDPKTTDRGLATHDGLQDFLDVYDEFNENIDTYVGRKSDLRKALKIVIDGDTEFQAKLRALRDDATAKKEEQEHYEFLLTNALETLDSSAQDHRQLLSEQEEAAKRKKKPVKP